MCVLTEFLFFFFFFRVSLKVHIEYLPPPNELMLRGVYGSGGFCVATTVLFPSVGELFELT